MARYRALIQQEVPLRLNLIVILGKDAADFNGDGYPDLFVGVTSLGKVQVYENAGGIFSTPTTVISGAGDDVYAVSSADFDGDGFIDIVAGGGSDGKISLWNGGGGGDFLFDHDIHIFGGFTSIDNYDFDGDGDQDLIAISFFDLTAFYLENSGGGTFAAPVTIGSTLDFALGIAAPPQPPIRSKVTGHIYSDLNGDGVENDGAIGIDLVSLSLTGIDYLGAPVDMMVTSAADGSYVFTGVPIDNGNGYTLEVVAPPDGLATTPDSRSVSIPKENTTVTENFLYAPAEEDLLERFAPILHLFEDDFRPKEIQSMVSESGLWRSNLLSLQPDTILTGTGNVTENDLAALSHDVVDYLNLTEAHPGFLSSGVPDADRFEGSYQTAIYGRLIENVTPGSEPIGNLPLLNAAQTYHVLQYWFFYPYNDWINNHEGDWEMIQIILDATTEAPLYATYSWHYEGTTYAWPTELTLDGDHPHVFVNRGGHGSYGNEGNHCVEEIIIPVSLPGGPVDVPVCLAEDETPSTDTGVLLHHLSTTCPTAPDRCGSYAILPIPEGEFTDAEDWNSFPGRWGEIVSSPDATLVSGLNGPRSPRYVQYETAALRWREPFTWANESTPHGVSAIAMSPVDLSVFDVDGRRVGAMPDGEVEMSIPGAYMFSPSDGGHESTIILGQQDLTFFLKGTGDGTMDFFVSQFGPAQDDVNAAFLDVPVTSSFIGAVQTSAGQPENIMEIDADGDGLIDHLYLEGAFPTLRDAVQALPDRAFQEGNAHLRTQLEKRTEKVEKEIEKGRYSKAVQELGKLLAELEKKVIQAEPEEGESSREIIEERIASLISVLQDFPDQEDSEEGEEDGGEEGEEEDD